MKRNRYKIVIFFICLLVACKVDPPEGFDESGCRLDTALHNLERNAAVDDIKVFLETSGSMSGFMPSQGETEFQKDVWALTEQLRHNALKKITIFQVKDTRTPLIPVNFQTFQNKINSGQFQASTSTEIPLMLDSVLSRTRGNSVSILISDLIFSPDATSNAQPRKAQITTDIRTRFQDRDLAASIFNFKSTFKTKRVTAKNSPYYVWIIGKPSEVSKVSSIVRKEFPNVDEINFGAKPIPVEGSLMPDVDPSSNAMAVRCESDGRFYTWSEYNDEGLNFYVALNLSELPKNVRTSKYIKENLDIEPGQFTSTLTSVETTPFNTTISLNDKKMLNKLNATHLLRFSLKEVLGDDTVLKFRLKAAEPLWINQIDTSLNDLTRIKTFGFYNMMMGLKKAYSSTQARYITNDFKIWISKRTID